MSSLPAGRGKYFWIFAASGFSGLIYESIWTHYLKLFLGHAAYAQTLVLAIFMGGMAVGAWACGQLSHRWRNLLAGYALVEGLVGLAAIAFHPVFVATVGTMQSAVLPLLGPGPAIAATKWGVGALLILPQSILLGMTFPLMSAGILRRFPDAPGDTIATLYFVNSLGGAAGVLVSGFWLIALAGLPGTVAAAGLLNLALALAVLRLGRAETETPPAPTVPPPGAGTKDAKPSALRLMLLVAALTGSSSFFYEIGWIRMLSLVLGSSTHAFELMLSAFILGLALGGLWVRRRIDRFASSVVVLGWVQVLMGLCALATLPLYGLTFRAMEWLMSVVSRTGTGYLQLGVAGHALASAVMLPAAMCAGMTLPLITHSLLRAGFGERSIGLVYGANTVGAIAGVVAAVHLAMPLLGLRNVILTGAAVDLGLGVLLLGVAARPGARRQAALALAVAGIAVLAAQRAVVFDSNVLSSGVFRRNQSLARATEAKVLFHRDGKTATVSVLGTADGVVQIRTNGKADASIVRSETGVFVPDEATAVLCGAAPLLLRPEARTAANIGFGSGLTTHVMLGHSGLRRVDTIEIEPEMIAGARLFHPRNRRAYEDPRSAIAIEDAKTFFASRRESYDAIVSEPSNPWVSGVSGLFTREFYRLASGFLAPGGLFVQWLQTYEIDEFLAFTVLAAIDESFADYAVYATNEGDMMILATGDAKLPGWPERFPDEPGLVAELARVGVLSTADLAVRRIGTKRSLAPLLAASGAPANSDYFPVLDQNANRARFLSQEPPGFISLTLSVLPVVEMLGGEAPPPLGAQLSEHGLRHGEPHPARLAQYVRDLVAGHPLPPTIPAVRAAMEAGAAKLLAECRQPPLGDRAYALLEIAMKVTTHLPPAENDLVWLALQDSDCVAGLRGPESDWLRLVTAVGRRDGAGMAAAAQRLLAARQDRTAARRRYLLGAGMLGSIVTGRPEQARELWHRVQSEEFPGQRPPIFWRLLAAHAGA